MDRSKIRSVNTSALTQGNKDSFNEKTILGKSRAAKQELVKHEGEAFQSLPNQENYSGLDKRYHRHSQPPLEANKS